MDFGANIALGFTTALQPSNLAIVAFGVTLGTLAGVLPGVGAITAISILLLTFVDSKDYDRIEQDHVLFLPYICPAIVQGHSTKLTNKTHATNSMNSNTA